MKTSNNELAERILTFSQLYVDQYKQALNHLPLVEVDEQWPSPCIQNKFDESYMCWQPVETQVELSFNNLEQALDINIHPSITQYYSVIFSESIPATCEEGHLQLLFAWSEDDFSRLQQNLIGHILMKQKLKQEVTLFFAITDDDDIMLSVNNANGEVWAERVGCQPHKKIANNLSEFIQSLKPDIYIESDE